MRSPMYRLTIVLLTGCAAFAPSAAAYERAIRDAQQLMDEGRADDALALLKEAQVDYPNAGELRFGIACALFRQGESLLESGAVEAGQDAVAEARSIFAGLAADANATVAREATFNNATVLAREALNVAAGEEYAAAVAALRRAVDAYESGLEQYPDHASMKQNLAFTRRRLKELLQNPPPEDEQTDPQQPPETPPSMMSRFGHVATDLPGARTRVEDNTAVLLPPGEEDQP